MTKVNILQLYKNEVEKSIQIIENSEDLKIQIAFKKLDEYFSNVSKPELDIDEFTEGGLVGFFNLSLKEPTPWLSIIAVGILGIVQAAAGAALIAFSGGAAISIGTMLLSEGIGDMIHAIKSGITGEFSWEDYAIQKAISVTITLATCGMGALKETGKVALAGAKAVKNIAVNGVSKQVLGTFTKESWKLAGKTIAVEFVKAGSKEIIKTVLDKTVLNKLSEFLNNTISKTIEDKVDKTVRENEIITNILAVDASLNTTKYKEEIESVGLRIINPKSNKLLNAASSIAQGIMSKLTDGNFGKIMKLFDAGKCLTELATFLDEFIKEFEKELKKLLEKLKIENLLENNIENMGSKDAKNIVKTLKENNFIDSDGIKIVRPVNGNILQQNNDQRRAVALCNLIYNETNRNSNYAFEKSLISRTLTDSLANRITNSINSAIINPSVHSAVHGLVDKFSDQIQIACAGSKGTLKEQMEKHRSKVQIIGKQNSVATNTKKTKNNEKQDQIDPSVEKIAKNAENDLEGGLLELGPISAAAKRPIKVLRNGVYDFTIGEENGGEPIVVNYLPNENKLLPGHWDGKDIVVKQTGPRNCLYDTISAQTNISTEDLRKQTANLIRQNSEHYSKMLYAVENLNRHEDKGLLYVGGAIGENSKPGTTDVYKLVAAIESSLNKYQNTNPAIGYSGWRSDLPISADKELYNKEFSDDIIKQAFGIISERQEKSTQPKTFEIYGMRHAFKEQIQRNQFNIEGIGISKDGKSTLNIDLHLLTTDKTTKAPQSYYQYNPTAKQVEYIKTNKALLTDQQKLIENSKIYHGKKNATRIKIQNKINQSTQSSPNI